MSCSVLHVIWVICHYLDCSLSLLSCVYCSRPWVVFCCTCAMLIVTVIRAELRASCRNHRDIIRFEIWLVWLAALNFLLMERNTVVSPETTPDIPLALNHQPNISRRLECCGFFLYCCFASPQVGECNIWKSLSLYIKLRELFKFIVPCMWCFS